MSEQDRSAFMQAAVRARHAARADSFMWQSLTAREQEVLGHLSHGRRVNEIARLNETSESTVRTQVKRVLAKLEVGSQTAAVVLALRAGWFDDI
jgi:DNA-binding NarL/FixJ family response regulator